MKRISVVLAAATLLVVAACGSPPTEPTRAGGGGEPRREMPPMPTKYLQALVDWVYNFDSLEEMVATTDVIVKAELVDWGYGKDMALEASGGGRDAYQPRTIELAVEKVLWVNPSLGESYKVPETLRTSDGSFDGTSATQMGGLQWAKPGSVGYYFLMVDDECETGDFSIINDEGRYLVDGEDVYGLQPETSNQPSSRLLKLSTSQLQDEIQAAIEVVRGGGIDAMEAPAVNCDPAQ